MDTYSCTRFSRAFIHLIGHPQSLGEAYHITSDEVLSWNQIVEITAQSLGVEPCIVHIPSETIAKFIPSIGPSLLGDKRWSLCFDSSKIKKISPGYRDKILFEQGIATTLDYHQKNSAYQLVNQEFDDQVDHLIKQYKP